jgi:hypothetical protein
MASSYSVIHPVDEILTSLVSEVVPSDSQLIANQIFENVKIPERSGTFLLENSRNFMGAGVGLDLERAPGAGRANIGSFDRTNLTFKALIYSAQDSIAMEDIIDSQYPGGEEARIVRKVRRAMMLAKEQRAADLIFNTASFSHDTCTNVMGGQVDAAGTDALTGLDKLKDLVFNAAHGINPDTLIFGRGVFRSLARNPEVRGYAGDVSGAGAFASGNRILTEEATKEVLRNILGIPNIYVGEARRETAVPGATSSEAQIWNTETIFCGIMKGSDAIVQKSGNVKGMPVAALNFEFGGMQAGQYDSLDATRRYVYAEEVQQFKAIDSTLGYILTDCLV